MERLTVVDEIFLRAHRGMGTPTVLQGLWLTDGVMSPELLARIHARLSAGQLGRRVVGARVPGARRGWVPTVRAHPLDVRAGTLAPAEVLEWADGLGTDLDPEFFPGWRMSVAALANGGTVIALTCSHVLADARGLLIAVEGAVRAALVESGAGYAGTRDNDLGEVGALALIPGQHSESDWVDAQRQSVAVLRGTVRAVWREMTRLDHLRCAVRARPQESGTGAAGRCGVYSSLHVFDAARFDRVAREMGGTPNSLFIWIVANTLWRTGFAREVIQASLPVDTRDEPRVNNDLSVTEIDIVRADTPATVRAKARDAYQRRMSAPAGLPEEILHLVGDRLAYRLSKGAGERDILCSNIGRFPAELDVVGSHKCTGVAARAIHPGLREYPRTRLSGYLTGIGDTYTLALTSTESDNAASGLESLCAAMGLTTTHPDR
ncbi:hypothetical protein [Nocardia camponoti]|uniref:Uncharacterized protein n=1 Tax=Nocardia camponoti TaxID=1616106 RepID=A0A917QGG1_9NOCA|nr:hypothetical protein [Nocardia camponoti]GGK49550.1 hypothetical protein GCM10011591_21210 [Nocardia camponoti]